MGVALTFGSDAHAPNEVGSDFEGAVALARQPVTRTGDATPRESRKR